MSYWGYFHPLPSDIQSYWSDLQISSDGRDFRKICRVKTSFIDLGFTYDVTGQVKDKMLCNFSDSMNERFPDGIITENGRWLTRNCLGGGGGGRIRPPRFFVNKFRFLANIDAKFGMPFRIYINFTPSCQLLSDFFENHLNYSDFNDPMPCHFWSQNKKWIKNRKKKTGNTAKCKPKSKNA